MTTNNYTDPTPVCDECSEQIEGEPIVFNGLNSCRDDYRRSVDAN